MSMVVPEVISVQPRYLIDTNILLYRHDAIDKRKRDIADALIRRFAGTGEVALPAQVLAEFSHTALRKFSPPLDAALVYAQVERLTLSFPIIPLTPSIVLEALRGVREHVMSYYDAQIWAAARLSQVTMILSEDFNSNTMLEDVMFINPFVSDVFQTN